MRVGDLLPSSAIPARTPVFRSSSCRGTFSDRQLCSNLIPVFFFRTLHKPCFIHILCGKEESYLRLHNMYVHIYMYIYMQKFRTLQKPSKAKLWEKVPGIFRFYFLEECMALRNQTLYESISVFFLSLLAYSSTSVGGALG